MLKDGAQVIVRCQEGPGFQCQTFEGLAVQNPALIVIAHCGSAAAQDDARALRDAVVDELLAMGAKAQASAPCGASSDVPVAGCHAEDEADCQKLLVMVSDGAAVFADHPDYARYETLAGARATLPLAPIAGKPAFDSLYPAWVGPHNAVFWSSTPAEGVPAVLALAGITAELPKLFISYRQVDSAGLAVQIFDALAHAGFDVFLDHFRIPPGVNFQARLTEQLGDKSMVLFLESADFLNSPWVTYEVNVAKTCSLGLHALNLCGAPMIDGIDDELRTRVTAGDFVGGAFGPTAKLEPEKLDEIVALVRREHDRAIVRRRQILEEALEGAVLRAGGVRPIPAGPGAVQIDAKSGGKRYVVALTPRPPDLPDFHRVHGHAVKPIVGVVVGLSRLMEPARHQRLAWLAGVSELRFRDEGDMLALGREMVQGSL